MSIIEKMNYYFKGLQEPPKYLYTEEETEQFEKYIKKSIGNYEMVYHELYSPDVHIDIIVIPPTKDREYYTLVTEGVGAYKMNTPSIMKKYDLDRMELVAYLPKEWNMNMEDEKYTWVIQQMKTIARTPIELDSWVSFGHSFANDEKAKKTFSTNTKYSAIILLNPLDNKNKCLELKLPDKGTINFYQLFPLYSEEYMYLRKNGLEQLHNKIPDKDRFPIININRKNYCENLINKDKEQDLEEEMDR